MRNKPVPCRKTPRCGNILMLLCSTVCWRDENLHKRNSVVQDSNARVLQRENSLAKKKTSPASGEAARSKTSSRTSSSSQRSSLWSTSNCDDERTRRKHFLTKLCCLLLGARIIVERQSGSQSASQRKVNWEALIASASPPWPWHPPFRNVLTVHSARLGA